MNVKRISTSVHTIVSTLKGLISAHAIVDTLWILLTTRLVVVCTLMTAHVYYVIKVQF